MSRLLGVPRLPEIPRTPRSAPLRPRMRQARTAAPRRRAVEALRRRCLRDCRVNVYDLLRQIALNTPWRNEGAMKDALATIAEMEKVNVFGFMASNMDVEAHQHYHGPRGWEPCWTCRKPSGHP